MIEDSNDKEELGSKLLISFPVSKEDHRLQLVKINESIFALVHSPLESHGPIHLHCEDWSLVLLAPVKSKSDIEISAINVICLSEISSEEGAVSLRASNRLVKFAPISKNAEKVSERGENGEHQLDDDPAAFLYSYRLFKGIMGDLKADSPEMVSRAQQRFISALCTLGDKIAGNSKNLNFKKVLEIWGIPAEF